MTKYFKSGYQFGILGGGFSVLSFYVLSLFYPDPTNLNLVFGYLITPFSVYLAIKFFKDYTNEKFLSFSEGMSVGAVSFFLLAVISTGGIWVILQLSPELFSTIQAAKLEILDKNKEVILSQVGHASFETTLANLSTMRTWDIALNDGIWKILPGMFFSILISIILRKNKI